MKNRLGCLLLFIANNFIVAQNTLPNENNWEKIIIHDTYGGWNHWNNHFLIDKKTLNLSYLNKPDSVLKKVDPHLITELFKSFSSTKDIEKDPLLIFGKDSLWLTNNAKQLWLEYLGNKNEPKEIDSIAVRAIKDYSKNKSLVWNMQDRNWRHDYPFLEIFIISGSDTIHYSSYGQYPFMYPWLGTNGLIYNYELPLTIGKLLPDSIPSNKSRLMGTSFNKILIDEIYYSYIEHDAEFERAKRKYKHAFKRIGKHFQINYAEISMMGSIEWGGIIAANCLELFLKDTAISKNIKFSTVFGRRFIPHPLNPIIRKKDKLINQLANNPVFNYCLKNDSCLGEIHLVNNKSLSRQAKRNFLSDVKDSGKDKNEFKGKFKKALFFELTENRNGQDSFSRWIFLKDGTIILWEIKGNYLMNLPKIFSEKNGYVCTIINIDEFEHIPKVNKH